MQRLISILTFCSLSAATFAQERVVPYPIFETAAWKKAVQAETRTTAGAPGAKYWTNYASYRISAELDPEAAKVTGQVEMVYENRSPKPLRNLAVHLRQNLHKEGATRNRPVEVTGGVTVGKILVDGEEVTKSRARARGTTLNVRPKRAVAPGGSVTLTIDWSFVVPKAGRAPRMGHEKNHVFYLGYWYPQFAVFDDVNGWVADQYLGNSEFYMDYADYDLEFTVPQGWLVRATGTLQNPKDVLTDTAIERLAQARAGREIVSIVDRDDLKAGEATRSSEGKLTWKFHSENVRDIAVSISDRYLWDATHAVVVDDQGQESKAMIHAVYEANARGWGKAAEYARHTIEYMSKAVYPYPWPQMTACEGIIGGGMEYPMMTIIGSTGRGTHGTVAHELIHMWFPMIIGSNEKRRAWMDEGITSFYTPITMRDYSGRKLDPARANMGYRMFVGRGSDSKPMTHGDYYAPGSSYGFATYSKTAAIMGQLKGMLGAEVFDKAMRRYARSWAFKHPYHHDLFSTFNEVAEQDLDWYFRAWFYESWSLDQSIAEVAATDKGTTVVVEDLGRAMMPAEVRVTYADGKTETQVVSVRTWLDGKTKVSLDFGPGVVEAVIDPDHKTLDIKTKNNVWKAN